MMWCLRLINFDVLYLLFCFSELVVVLVRQTVTLLIEVLVL